MNLRQVRKKIKSVSNVKKITKAMQMVSAVKMRKAIAKSLQGKLYRQILFERLREITSPQLLASLQFWGNQNSGKKHLKIVFCSNKGLCGSFNTIVLKEVVKNFDKTNDAYVIFGKKALPVLNALGAEILADFSHNNEETLIESLFSLAKSKFLQGDYHSLTCYYNQFVSASTFVPKKLELLPLNLQVDASQSSSSQYKIEPDPSQLLPQLISDTLIEQLRLCYYDSQSSEHSARMLAMKNSTDSASELVDDLTKLRNRFRQAQITNELLDSTSSKAAFTN